MKTRHLYALLSVLVLVEAADSHEHANCGEHADNNTFSDCTGIYNVFHKCTGRFLEVALKKSNPFTICTDQQAYSYYRNQTFWLKVLENTRDKKNHNMTTCADNYLHKNQMSVISHIVSTSQSIWQNANCDDCYADKLSPTFSEHTISFYESHKKYEDCKSKHKNATMICKECVSYYLRLNEFFNHEKMKREGKICFDLEDVINKTRQEWSVEYKCCRDKRDSLTAFYSLFSTIMILTLIFYTSIYVTGSNCSESPTLDATEISGHDNERPSTSSGSSASSSGSKPIIAEPENLLSLNNDSDDELLISNNAQSTPNNSNLLVLDN